MTERLEICLANITRNDDDSSTYFTPTDGVTALHQYAESGAKSKEILSTVICFSIYPVYILSSRSDWIVILNILNAPSHL